MSLALTDWRILLTDLNSNPIAEISDDAIEPTYTQELNGIDVMTFSLNLESQAAYQITPMKTLVKMWRDVPGYTPFPDGLPQFCGVIGARTRNAGQRTASYTAYSPFWRLTFRYHVDAHDFSGATGKGVYLWNLHGAGPADDELLYSGYDPTDIMWEMLDFTNNLVVYTGGDKSGVKTGGAKPAYSTGTLYDARYSVGQNTWDLVQDIVQRPGYPDLNPTYIHTEGSQDLVWFNTTTKKGDDKSFSLDYRTGNKNLDDITETVQVEPGEYANYVVIQGQGDKTTGKFKPLTGDSGGDQSIVRADGVSGGPAAAVGVTADLISEYGLYMHFERAENATKNTTRVEYGQSLIKRLAYPPVSYEISPSSALTWAWPYEFQVGDSVLLNCARDSMQITNYRVRIMKVTIQRTPNKMEKVTLTVVDPNSYKYYLGGL
jgi:hypothetical protein